MSSVAIEVYTPEEYLARERAAETKSEYYNGRIYAMSGASREHNLAGGNLFGELYPQLRGKDCEMYMSDMRVKVETTSAYVYPDVVVVCGEPQFEDTGLDTLTNPTVIIEILSASTESHDRTAKSAHYRRIPSLQHYVLISQDRMFVEMLTRQPEGWLLTEMEKADDVLKLTAICCEVPLKAIYTRITFPTPEQNTEAESRVPNGTS